MHSRYIINDLIILIVIPNDKIYFNHKKGENKVKIMNDIKSVIEVKHETSLTLISFLVVAFIKFFSFPYLKSYTLIVFYY